MTWALAFLQRGLRGIFRIISIYIPFPHVKYRISLLFHFADAFRRILRRAIAAEARLTRINNTPAA